MASHPIGVDGPLRQLIPRHNKCSPPNTAVSQSVIQSFSHPTNNHFRANWKRGIAISRHTNGRVPTSPINWPNATKPSELIFIMLLVSRVNIRQTASDKSTSSYVMYTDSMPSLGLTSKCLELPKSWLPWTLFFLIEKQRFYYTYTSTRFRIT